MKIITNQLSVASLMIIFIIFLFSACQKSERGVNEKVYSWVLSVDSLWHQDMPTAMMLADSLATYLPEIDEDTIQSWVHYQLAVGKYSRWQTSAALHHLSIAEKKNDLLIEELNARIKSLKYTLILKQSTDDSLINSTVNTIIKDSIGTTYKWMLIDHYLQIGNVKLVEKLIKDTVVFQYSNKSLMVQLVYAKYLIIKSNYSEATNILDQLIIKFNDANDQINLAETYLNLANLHIAQANYLQAQKIMDKAVAIYSMQEYDFGLARVNMEYANIFYYLNDMESCILYYLKALEYLEKNPSAWHIEKIKLDMAWVYTQQSLFSKAKEFLNDFDTVAFNNTSLVAYAHNTRGYYYTKLHEYDSSLKYYQKAAIKYGQLGVLKSHFSALYNVALSYERTGKVKQAIDLQKSIYDYEFSYSSARDKAISETYIGRLYLKLGETKKAEYYLSKSNKMLMDYAVSAVLIENLEASVMLALKMGNKDKVIALQSKIIDYKNQSFSEAGQSRLAELEIIYELKKKDDRIEILDLQSKNQEQEIALKERQIANQKVLLYASLIGFVLIGLLLYISFRLINIKNKANTRLENLNREIQEQKEEIMVQAEELQEANDKVMLLNEHLEELVQKRTKDMQLAKEELDHFYYRASHDFKGPISTLLGLVDIANMGVKDPNALELFEKMQTTTLKLERFITKLNLISIINEREIVQEQVNWHLLFDPLIKRAQLLSNTKKINIKKEVDSEAKLNSDIYLLKQMLDFILENAVKFSNKPNSTILIKVTKDEKGVQIKIRDEGDGILDSLKPKVFDMYLRGSSIADGNGVGLFVVKKIAEKLNAILHLDSKYGLGTEITIFFRS